MQWSPDARLYFTPFKSTDTMMPSSLWRVFISNALLFRTASADSLVCRRQSVEMSRHNTCLWHKWVMLLCRTCTHPSDDMNMREICETLRDPVCQHNTHLQTHVRLLLKHYKMNFMNQKFISRHSIIVINTHASQSRMYYYITLHSHLVKNIHVYQDNIKPSAAAAFCCRTVVMVTTRTSCLSFEQMLWWCCACRWSYSLPQNTSWSVNIHSIELSHKCRTCYDFNWF